MWVLTRLSLKHLAIDSQCSTEKMSQPWNVKLTMKTVGLTCLDWQVLVYSTAISKRQTIVVNFQCVLRYINNIIFGGTTLRKTKLSGQTFQRDHSSEFDSILWSEPYCPRAVMHRPIESYNSFPSCILDFDKEKKAIHILKLWKNACWPSWMRW